VQRAELLLGAQALRPAEYPLLRPGQTVLTFWMLPSAHAESLRTLVGTQVTDGPVRLEMDASKREYLHPVAGSDAAQLGAGLFTR